MRWGDCYYFIVKSQFVFVGALCSHSPGGILMVQPSNLPYVVQEFMNHSLLEPEKNVPSWAEWSRLVVCRTDNCHLKDALICWSDWIYNVITMPEFFFVILVQNVAEKIQDPSMGCSNFWDLAVGFVFNA